MQRSLEARTASLDRNVRSALANEIENSLGMGTCDRGGGDDEEGENENPLEVNLIQQQRQASSAPIQGEEQLASHSQQNEESSHALAELDIVLSKCRASLAKFERAEKFVSIRVNSYRKMLADQSFRLSPKNKREKKARESGRRRGSITETREEDELEDGLDEEKRGLTAAGHDAELGEAVNEEEKERRKKFEEEEREKLRRNDESLAKVQETHHTMVENIARMKLRIATLERKREEIISARDECRDFLVAAAQVEEYEMSEQVASNDGEGGDSDGEEDLEAGGGNSDKGVVRESELVGLKESPSNLHKGAGHKPH